MIGYKDSLSNLTHKDSLHKVKLGDEYQWEEETKTAVYVRNTSPHKGLENKTPEEMFSGEKSEVNHLRIFGCPVFVHVPKEKRTKLDPSGKNGISFGYNDTSKEYMIYILGHQKVEIRRDVTFDESESFSKSKHDCENEVHEEENEVTRVQRPRENKGGKRHRVHTTEDDEPPKKVAKEDESSDEECIFISALIGTVTHGSDIWLVDSGASKHMTCYKESLSNLTHKDSLHKVKLGDDYQWEEAIKTGVYVQNISPHKVLENKTLEEMFSGEKS
jgi:hypothetical protein